MNELAIIEEIANGNGLSNYLGDNNNYLGDLNNFLGDDDTVNFFGSVRSLADEAAIFTSEERLKALGNGPNFKMQLINNSATPCQIILNTDYNYSPGGSLPTGVLRDGTFDGVNNAGAATSTITANSLGTVSINNFRNYLSGRPTRCLIKIEATDEVQAKSQMSIQNVNPFEEEGRRILDISSNITSKDFNAKIVFVNRVVQFDAETNIKYTLLANANVMLTFYPISNKSIAKELHVKSTRAAGAFHNVKKQVESGMIRKALGGIPRG